MVKQPTHPPFRGINRYASSMITAVEPWSGHYPVDDADMGVVRSNSFMFIAVRLPT